MFKGIKQIFSARNKDVKNKILFTLLILFIYKLGTTVRVPGTENITQDLGFLELLNVMGGGSLKNFSIFALGVTPYISASIIVQLLQMDIIPYFSNLAKEGYLAFSRGRYGGTFVIDIPEMEEQAFKWLAVNPKYAEVYKN